MEMVFRGLYHYAQALTRGESLSVVAELCRSVVAFLCEHQRLLGIVKARRKRHRRREAQWQQIEPSEVTLLASFFGSLHTLVTRTCSRLDSY
jgi:hypothetical protein